MLTATDLRTSKTAKIKKLYYYIAAHRRTSMCSRVAQKSKPPPIFQKIALKIANEIRFLRKVKV